MSLPSPPNLNVFVKITPIFAFLSLKNTKSMILRSSPSVFYTQRCPAPRPPSLIAETNLLLFTTSAQCQYLPYEGPTLTLMKSTTECFLAMPIQWKSSCSRWASQSLPNYHFPRWRKYARVEFSKGAELVQSATRAHTWRWVKNYTMLIGCNWQQVHICNPSMLTQCSKGHTIIGD